MRLKLLHEVSAIIEWCIEASHELDVISVTSFEFCFSNPDAMELAREPTDQVQPLNNILAAPDDGVEGPR